MVQAWVESIRKLLQFLTFSTTNDGESIPGTPQIVPTHSRWIVKYLRNDVIVRRAVIQVWKLPNRSRGGKSPEMVELLRNITLAMNWKHHQVHKKGWSHDLKCIYNEGDLKSTIDAKGRVLRNSEPAVLKGLKEYHSIQFWLYHSTVQMRHFSPFGLQIKHSFTLSQVSLLQS